jgi:hypothetical protein
MDEFNALLTCAQQSVGLPGKIALGYLATIGLSSIVVRLTPTLKDDDVLKNMIRFVGKYVALNRK